MKKHSEDDEPKQKNEVLQEELKTENFPEEPKQLEQPETGELIGETKSKRLRFKFKRPNRRLTIVLGVLFSVFAIGATAWVVPKSRYIVLNQFGSADASIRVINATSKQPIAQAKVTLTNGDSSLTNEEGIAFFNDTNYGMSKAVVDKNTYESRAMDVVISKDNIQLGDIEIEPIGIPVNIEAVDWLTKKTIESFTVKLTKDSEPITSVKGIATVNIPIDAESIELEITSEGYNQKVYASTTDDSKLNREPNSKEDVTTIPVDLVLAGEHYFISDREGDVSFYESNYDGSNIEKLVTTNQKNEYFEYYPIPNTELYVALMTSTGKSNNGRQDQLALIDTESKTLKIIDEAPGQKLDLSIVSSSKDNIVYQVQYETERTDRYKTKSYSFATGKLTTHFSSPSYFWPVYDEARNAIYINISVGSYPGDNGFVRKLEKITIADNKLTRILSDQDISSVYIHPSKPDKLLYYVYPSFYNTVSDGYYLLDLTDNSKIEYIGNEYPDFEEPDEIPDSEKGQASPNNTNRIWIDQRDNNGRIILNESSNVLTGEVDNLSVTSIIRWVSDTKITVVGSDGRETADYIVDIETGNFRKIVNSLTTYYGGYGY